MTKSALQYLFNFCRINNRVFILLLFLYNISVSGISNTSILYSGDSKTGAIAYFIWLDYDANGQYDIGEQILKGINVELFEASKDRLISSFQVIDEGRFYFKDLPKGIYYLNLSFIDREDQLAYQPVNENQFQEEKELSHFKTKPFLFDPTESTRKNINFPFQNQLDLSQEILSTTCTDFIDTSFIQLTIENCDNTTSICIDEAIADMLSYSITDNGQAYTGLVSPCDFDTSFAYTYSSIPDAGLIGPYYVDLWTVDGINYQGTVTDMATLTDSMNVWDNSGNWSHDSFTSSIRGGSTLPTYSSIEITQVATDLSATMSLNTTLNPNGSQLTLETGFHELVFTEPIENCTDTIEVMINCIPCEVIYDDITSFELDDCTDNQSICFDVSEDDWSEYNVSTNGIIYTGNTNPCSVDSFYQYSYAGLPGGGTLGPYLLQGWNVDGTIYLGGFNSIGDLVDSMNVWDLGGDWQISDPLQTITGGHSDKNYSGIDVLQILTNTSGTAPVEKLASVTSMEITLDTGFHQVVFFNNSNQCMDTIDFDLNCCPCSEYLADTLIQLTANHCDSNTIVCLPIPFLEINDYTVSLNGDVYTQGFTACGMNTSIALDTGNYQVLLNHNIKNCVDSATILIDCIPTVACADFLNEDYVQIQINDCEGNGAFCIEIPFDEISDFSISDNASAYTGTLSDCAPGTNITLESGFHELFFTNNTTACSDTIHSMVACLESETISSTIIVTESDTICLDTFDLIGYIVSVNNVCEASSEELALIEIDPNNSCLIIEGIEAGTEQACIEVCDNYGFCDTTFINIEVQPLIEEPGLVPVANADLIQIEQDEKVNIHVLENDELNGTMTSFGILTVPDHGTITIVDDSYIEYTAEQDHCTPTSPDSLVYVICNDVGCDEAVVSIVVNCKDIFVHNAFSPNGDGQNEYFVINGAPNKPNNSLSVFNRYGGRVFFENGYQNDWNGTWEGEDLPDGTYFYFFEDGTGSAASGYVQIQR